MIFHKRLAVGCNTGLWLIAYLWLAAASQAWADDPRRVLILNSYHEGFPWSDTIMEAIQAEFAKTGLNVDLSFEYMDTKRYPPEQLFPYLAELYQAKFYEPFEVIILSDNNALDFLLTYRDSLFPGVPVVFSGINNFDEALLGGHTGITGVTEETDIQGTLELILRLHPDTEQIAVISDVTETSHMHLHRLREITPPFREEVKFIELTNWTAAELKAALQRLPERTVIVFLSLARDRAGASFSVKEGFDLVSRHSDLPVYSLWDSFIGWGALGGVVISGRLQGEKAAQMAIRILNGEPTEAIPILRESPNAPMFDYLQLQRFGIPLSALPEGSILIKEPHSFYYRYWMLIWVGLAFILFQTLVIIMLVINIIRRRQAEAALRESEERFRQLAEHLHEVFWIVDITSLQILYVSPAYEAIWGRSCRSLYEHPTDWLNAIHPADRPGVQHAFLRKKVTGAYNQEYRILRPDGTIRWIRDHGFPIHNATGQIYRFAGIAEDITERKQAKEQMQQHQTELARMAHLSFAGGMASGLAHELNQPLAAIVNYTNGCLRLLRSGKVNPNRLIKAMEEVTSQALRAGEIIHHLRRLVRKEEPERAAIDINKLVQEVTRLAAPEAQQHNIRIQLKLADLAASIFANNIQIQQVVLNLVRNSIEAIEEGKTRRRELTLQTKPAGDEAIEITVADTGPGLSPEALEQLFLPFFTTKANGMGLGLSITQSIVEAHGGCLWVTPNPDQGVTFHFTLPTVKEMAMVLKSDCA